MDHALSMKTAKYTSLENLYKYGMTGTMFRVCEEHSDIKYFLKFNTYFWQTFLNYIMGQK